MEVSGQLQSGCFIFGERASSTRQIGGSAGSEAGLYMVAD